MKQLISALLMVFLVVPSFAQDNSDESQRPLVRFDRNHSTMGFNAPIVEGLSKVTGKFTDFSVDLYWNEEDPSASTVSVEIRAESVATGIENRDNHLRSEDFFNVAVYPTITFESTGIRPDGDDFVVDGVYTMLGVSKEISFPLTVTTFTSDEGDSWTAYRLMYSLDRTEYGMTWKHSIADFFLGDVIETDIVLITR